MSTTSSTASAPSPSPSPPPVSPRSTVNSPEFRSQHFSSPTPSPSPTTEPIHVNERRAFVDCEPYPPLPVRLAFQFLPESNVASFRLRVSVVLNGSNIETPEAVPRRNKKNSGHVAKKRKYTRHAQQTQSTQPEQTTLYVSINPEDILSITYEKPLSSSTLSVAKAGISSVRALPAAISAAWSSSFTTGQDALCLHFTLARPPQLMAPTSRASSDGQSLRGSPAGQTDSKVLAAWRSLSGRLEFGLYTTADLLTTSQLAIMCGAASTPGLLKSSARHHDLSSLYGGRGGAVVYAEVVEKNHTSPPSYDELALSPPPLAHQGHNSYQSLLSSPARQPQHGDGQSRLQGSILSATTPIKRNKGKQQPQQEPQDKADGASPVPLVSVKAEMTALLLSQFSELEARLTERLDRRLDHHQPELCKAAMAERLSELQDTMTQYVDEQVDLLRQEIWESLEDRWDDHRLSTRADLDDYIDEKIQDAREEIKDRLQNTGVTLLFNDCRHVHDSSTVFCGNQISGSVPLCSLTAPSVSSTRSYNVNTMRWKYCRSQL